MLKLISPFAFLLAFGHLIPIPNIGHNAIVSGGAMTSRGRWVIKCGGASEFHPWPICLLFLHVPPRICHFLTLSQSLLVFHWSWKDGHTAQLFLTFRTWCLECLGVWRHFFKAFLTAGCCTRHYLLNLTNLAAGSLPCKVTNLLLDYSLQNLTSVTFRKLIYTLPWQWNT